jgi:DNA-binding response OmpR family regulator
LLISTARRLALEYCGAFVNTAASATQAKSILQKLRPNVIGSDITLPDDGLYLVRDVREMGLNVPVIATTAHVTKYNRTTLKELGFVEVLYKPLSPERLCETVAEVLRSRHSADVARARSRSAWAHDAARSSSRQAVSHATTHGWHK